MKHFVILFAFISITSGGRIFGGKNATPGQFPFIASINHPYQCCDGSIISKSWILTAAHCLEEINPGTRILVGTVWESYSGTKYSIVETIKHDQFNPVTLQNDIALIKIDGEFDFGENVKSVEISHVGVNSTCVAVGWGTTENDYYPDNVHYVELSTISLMECGKLAAGNLGDLYLGEGQICTMGSMGKGTCYGDSGGPLVCDGKLVGIISYGVLPCARALPDVYTKVGDYQDWIKQNIDSV